MKRLALVVVLFSLCASASSLAATQEKPAAAAPPPAAAVERSEVLPLAQDDVQAIAGAVQVAQGYAAAIAVLQKELDAAQANFQRAIQKAQAAHPSMQIDLQTMTYRPKPKSDPAPPAKKGGGGR